MLDPAGPRRKGLVIETLVTTKLLGRIVAARGESDLIDDLLVGLQIRRRRAEAPGPRRPLPATCRRRPEELVLAAEESHGVIALPHILDKDATPACMYLAGLYQRLAAEGRTLLDYYTGILEELGGFDTVNRSIMMAGASGMQRKDRIMAWLRADAARPAGGPPGDRGDRLLGRERGSARWSARASACPATWSSCRPTASSSPCGRRAPSPS